MLFDWFTLFAQLVNFLVLVWLLKRYLYKPILDTIDERERLISTQILEAEASKTDAVKELENYQHRNIEFDQQRKEMLTNVITEVNTERHKLLAQTRNEVELLRNRLQESLRNEQQNLGAEIVRRTRNEVFSIARKTLSDLASVNLEDQMASVFINRIEKLATDEKDMLYMALSESSSAIFVRSIFELTLAQQSAIQSAIRINLNITPEIKFENAPHLVSGIELIAKGYKLSWTIDDYLVSMETLIAELLDQKTDITSERL